MERRIVTEKQIIGFIIFLVVVASPLFAYDDGDFQVWHTEVQELKINKELKVILEEELRFADDANDFYYHHYDLGFVYSLIKIWILA